MKRKKDLLFYNNNNNFFPSVKRHSLEDPAAPRISQSKKYENIIVKPATFAKPIKNISDSQGLELAYRQPNGIYNYGNTIYIAGTKSLNDAWDDLKIPFHATRYSQRYKDAENM